MSEFEIADYAQMRRCRLAQLLDKPVTEQLHAGDQVAIVHGYVRSVTPDLTRWPVRWFVTIDDHVQGPMPSGAAAKT